MDEVLTASGKTIGNVSPHPHLDHTLALSTIPTSWARNGPRFDRILISKFLLAISQCSKIPSRSIMPQPCFLDGFVYHPRSSVPRADARLSLPTPLHVSRRARVFCISHRHSMTLFAERYAVLRFALIELDSGSRGEAAYLKAKCNRAEVIDVLARRSSSESEEVGPLRGTRHPYKRRPCCEERWGRLCQNSN